MFRLPRDHDIVEDSLGRLYVVIGNLHPPDRLIAYLKYVPTTAKTLWTRGSTCYDRVLKTYGVRSLHKYLRGLQEFNYDPVFNTYVPTVKRSSIIRYYYPEVRLRELISCVNDELELAVVEFTDMLRSYAGISVTCLGVTGSLLTKTHNVNVSDADVVIYGCKPALDFIEHLNDFLKVKLDRVDLIKQAEVYGLDPKVLSMVAPPYKKLLIRNKEINVLFVDDAPPPRYGSKMYLNLGVVEAIVQIYGNDCRALMYPSIAPVEKVINIVSGSYGEDIIENIKYVVSYEGLYSYTLFLGGTLVVRGILQLVLPDECYRILVGGIEERGYVIPIRLSAYPTTSSALRNT